MSGGSPALWRPCQRADFAELAKQLLPTIAAVGRMINFTADTVGVNPLGLCRMKGEVPDRRIGEGGQGQPLPTEAAVAAAPGGARIAGRAVAVAKKQHFG